MSFADGGTEVLGHIRIHYTSDTLNDYLSGLYGAKTLSTMKEHVQTYRRVASDAFEVVEKMSAEDFRFWRKGLAMERKQQFAGEEWATKYGPLVMPEVLMRVGLVASHFKAPWGCAYIRCREEGLIKESSNVARWAQPPVGKTSSENV